MNSDAEWVEITNRYRHGIWALSGNPIQHIISDIMYAVILVSAKSF